MVILRKETSNLLRKVISHLENIEFSNEKLKNETFNSLLIVEVCEHINKRDIGENLLVKETVDLLHEILKNLIFIQMDNINLIDKIKSHLHERDLSNVVFKFKD